MNPDLIANLDDAVLSIRLNRSQERNAHPESICAALARLLTVVSEDESVRVLLLRGNGTDDGFGMNSAGHAEATADLTQALRQLPQPIMAMVQGQCRGAALALIEACDIVLAADTTDLAIENSPTQRVDLVSQFVAAKDLESQTYALARDLASKDPLALRFTKQTLRQVPDIGWNEVLAFTTAKQNELKVLQAGQPSARAMAVESFLAGKSKPGAGA